MAAKTKAAKGAAKAGKAYANARTNPYLQLLADDELRENVRDAYESSVKAYGRLANGKTASKVVLKDKKFHKELSNAAESLRDIGDSLRKGPKRKKKRLGLGKLLLLGLVGAGAAVALSEGLRSKVLDLLFGAEEEFDYSSN